MTASRKLLSFLLIVLVVAFMFSAITLESAYATTTSKAKVKITWNANGGKIDSAKTKTISYKKGAKINKLQTAKRKGYSLNGWYTKKSGGSMITKNTKATKKATYYAHWTPNKYTITFDGNGGTPTKKTKKATYKKAVGTLPSGSKPEYELAGWYTAAVGGTKVTNSYVYNTTKDMTLYAHWILKQRMELYPGGMDNTPVWDSWVESNYVDHGFIHCYDFQSGSLTDSSNKLRMANLGSWHSDRAYMTYENERLVTGSYITYLLDCKFTNMQATLFLGWESRLDSDTVKVNVYNDNVLVYTSPILTKDVKPITFQVGLRNVERMKIEFVSDDNWQLPEFGLTASLGQI